MVAILILIIIGCASVDKNEFIPLYLEVSSETFTIPEGYKSYTLLFATSYDYVENASAQDMQRLKKKIQRFGKSIGKENLTIWVNKPSSEELNVELGKTYSDRIYSWHKIKLDYRFIRSQTKNIRIFLILLKIKTKVKV